MPPLVSNAYVGMRGMEMDVVERARGMGMTGAELLWRVELPIALPVIMAGVRTAAVQVVATASLAAVTAWGGLGRFVVDGFGQRDDAQIVAGAILVALLALVTELALGRLQRAVVSEGLRRGAEQVEQAPAVVTA